VQCQEQLACWRGERANRLQEKVQIEIRVGDAVPNVVIVGTMGSCCVSRSMSSCVVGCVTSVTSCVLTGFSGAVVGGVMAVVGGVLSRLMGGVVGGVSGTLLLSGDVESVQNLATLVVGKASSKLEFTEAWIE